jgi:hypothetical protein
MWDWDMFVFRSFMTVLGIMFLLVGIFGKESYRRIPKPTREPHGSFASMARCSSLESLRQSCFARTWCRRS